MTENCGYCVAIHERAVIRLSSPASLDWAYACMSSAEPIFRRGKHWIIEEIKQDQFGLRVSLIELRILRMAETH